MSVPVRNYSVARRSVVVDREDDNRNYLGPAAVEMRRQRISIGGRLGTPDAAARNNITSNTAMMMMMGTTTTNTTTTTMTTTPNTMITTTINNNNNNKNKNKNKKTSYHNAAKKNYLMLNNHQGTIGGGNVNASIANSSSCNKSIPYESYASVASGSQATENNHDDMSTTSEQAAAAASSASSYQHYNHIMMEHDDDDDGDHHHHRHHHHDHNDNDDDDLNYPSTIGNNKKQKRDNNNGNILLGMSGAGAAGMGSSTVAAAHASAAMMMAATSSSGGMAMLMNQSLVSLPLSLPPLPPPSTTATTESLFAKLHEALSLEPKYQPSLYLPSDSQDGEITIGTRDGAAHVLRCLKVWYELPTDVLFTAINLVDRFLTKMRVRPKHMACISVGSLHLAVKQLNLQQIDTEDLIVISQCRCTSGDLERMSGIIANKLGVQMGTCSTTALTFIRLFYYIFLNAAHELGLADFYNRAISLVDLEMRLEILTCDANCASIRASELALVLICTQMDAHVSNLQNGMHNNNGDGMLATGMMTNDGVKQTAAGATADGTATANANGVPNNATQIHGLVDYAIELQKLCRIPDSTFFHSHSTVVRILSNYNNQHKMPYRQRLVWKLSSRTMRVLRPTDKLTSYLPTIEEHNQNGVSAAVAAANLARLRTGSVSSEDGEDWPTSPVVPVYEQC